MKLVRVSDCWGVRLCSIEFDYVRLLNCSITQHSIAFEWQNFLWVRLSSITERSIDYVGCIARNLLITAGHIAGKGNIQADLESRQNQSQTEWLLNITSLSQSLRTLRFKQDIDLFASRLNSQLYVAYRLDPESVATDAFTIHWANI